MTLAVGGMLGRYRLDALLGRGGMAEVFRATDTRLDRTVALKVILTTHADDAQFLERFAREARTVASLEHPNILPVYDFGEENGVPFLVMPYLSGGSLHDRLKAGPVPLALAAAWIAQLSDALDAAHAAGVLHRDVKPANVLLGKDDRLFLADFGIAKMLESEKGLTATGVVVGTPIYMAPEQAQGHPASAATDRYALAVVAFEILAGRPPFEGDNALSLMHQHVSTPPPMLSARVAGLPAGLDGVLSQALAKNPGDRPPTCRAFATGVAMFAPALSTPAHGLPFVTGPGGAVIPTAPTARATAPTAAFARPSERTPSLTGAPTVLTGPARRGPGRGALLAAGALAALAGAWWVSTRSGPPASPAAVPPPTVAAATPAPSPAPAVSTTSALPATPAPAAVSVVEKPAPPAAAPTPAPAAPGTHARASAQPAVKPPPPPAVPAPEPVAASADDDRAHPLAAARQRLEAARTSGQRLTKADFNFVLAESERALRRHPLNPEAKYFEMYARGGLAYVAGNDPLAAKVLVEALSALDRGPKRGGHPIVNLLRRPDGTIGPPNAWELAIGYGDARGEAAGLLDKALAADPHDARAQKARAQLRRMQDAR